MIKKLSFCSVLVLLLVSAFSLSKVNAQPYTLVSNYSNAPSRGIYNANPGFLTFTVYNNRPGPIEIQEIGNYHVGQTLTFPNSTTSQNGQSYSLWYKNITLSSSSLNPTPISPVNGWTLAKTGDPITTTTNAITPVITGLNLIICSGQSYSFALVSDTVICAANGTLPLVPLTPATYSLYGVTFEPFITPSFWWGAFPGGPAVQGGGASFTAGFMGSVSFDTIVSAVTPPDVYADPVSVCKGDSTWLVAKLPTYAKCAFPNPVFNWTWAGGSATGDSVKVLVNETLIYNCTVTSQGKTSAPSSVKVIAIDPEPPLVTGRFAYCVNDQFEPLEVEADSILWYYVDKGGSALPIAPTINTSLGPQKDTFYAAQWKNGCFSERTRVILSAATKPAKPIVTTPLYYCEGQPAPPLEAIGNEMQWFYFPVGGVPTSIAPTPPTSVRNKFNYYVANNNDGCEGPREHIEVFVEFRPNGLIVPSRERLCEGDTMTVLYYGSAFDSSAFLWQIPSAGISLTNDSVRGPITLRFDSVGTYNILLQVGSGSCLSEIYKQPVKVEPIPKATITANQHVCRDATELVSLETYDEGIDTFKWDFGAGSRTTHYVTDQGPYGVIWSKEGQPVITLTIIQGICADTLYDTIEVRPAPDARINIDQPSPTGIYCAGDSIRVTAHTIHAGGGATYTWSPERFFDTYNNLYSAYAIVDFTSYLKLTVEDQYGCKNTDSIEVKTEPCCKLTFPTAFSPNGDGKNDFFKLLNVNHFENYNTTHSLNYDVRTFRVMNRWGVTVYESANELRGWDGNFNGEPQDMGTYYWFVSYMCGGKMINEKGEIVLVR